MGYSKVLYGAAKVELGAPNLAQTASEGWTELGNIALETVKVNKEAVSLTIKRDEAGNAVSELVGDETDRKIEFASHDLSVENMALAYGGTAASGVYTSPAAGTIVKKAVKITDRNGNVAYFPNVAFSCGEQFSFTRKDVGTIVFSGVDLNPGGFKYTAASEA